jgi:hypothetical protein
VIHRGELVMEGAMPHIASKVGAAIALVVLTLSGCGGVEVVPSPFSGYRSQAEMVPSSFVEFDRTAVITVDGDPGWHAWRR